MGNGPSGCGQGVEIDACDFVVRMQTWVEVGPRNAGEKVSAIAGHKHFAINIPESIKNDFSWELWGNIPIEFAGFPPSANSPLEVEGLVRLFGPARTLRFASLKRVVKLVDAVTKASVDFEAPRVTCGIVCIDMVLDFLKPEELHIWGFDCVRKDAPALYGNGLCYPVPKTNAHDFLAEKVVIKDFADNGLWCGEPVSTKLIWHGRPEGI